jgi:hypothetical protein
METSLKSEHGDTHWDMTIVGDKQTAFIVIVFLASEHLMSGCVCPKGFLLSLLVVIVIYQGFVTSVRKMHKTLSYSNHCRAATKNMISDFTQQRNKSILT